MSITIPLPSGFEVTVDHPHTHVVRAVQQLKIVHGPNENGAGGPPNLNDLARSSYFMATESLHLSTFCLQYRPSLVAAVCVHIACKWAKYEVRFFLIFIFAQFLKHSQLFQNLGGSSNFCTLLEL